MSTRAERGVARSLAVRVGSAAALVTTSVGGAVALDTTRAPRVDAATTFEVDVLTDASTNAGDCINHVAGQCSLRDALEAATNGDTITFSDGLFANGPRTLQLSGLHGRLVVKRSVSIVGPGATKLTVRADGAYQFRTLTVLADATDVTISGLTFTNGREGTGGGIRFGNAGTTRLEDVVLTGNTSTAGGGGAYFDNSVNVSLVKCTVHGNTSTAGNGAGLYFRRISNLASIIDTTIDGNITTVGSAAALRFGWSATNVLIANSTITGNASATGSPVASHAGGTLTLAQSTITGNTGGVAVSDRGAYVTALTLSGTVLSGNATTELTMVSNNDAAMSVVGNGSFIGTIDGRLTLSNPLVGSPNQRGTDPKVGALTDNGGPTRTMLPLAGSPLLDAGPDPVLSFPPLDAWDQRGRGYPRTEGPRVDIGAIELPAPPAPTSTTSTTTSTTPATTVAPSTSSASSTSVEPAEPIRPAFAG